MSFRTVVNNLVTRFVNNSVDLNAFWCDEKQHSKHVFYMNFRHTNPGCSMEKSEKFN